jgi:nitrogen regulatory protein P-II 1
MRYRKITTIVPMDRLEAVEEALKEAGTPGLSITKVKGYGGYKNFYDPDWCATHGRVEVFIAADQADATVQAILEAAHTGGEDDGLIVVLPVESLISIRTRELVS